MKMKKLFAICLVALSALISVHLQAQEVETLVLIDTDMGKIKVKLFNDTPQHRDNFIKNVKEHRYDGLLFHRVIKQFMVQAGDINSKDAPMEQHLGDGDLDYTIPAEIVYPKYFHKRGMFAAARTGDEENPERASSATQFYIVTGKFFTEMELDKMEKEQGITFTPEQRQAYMLEGGTPHLDGKYTIFGEVVSGMKAVDKIQFTETNADDRPVKNKQQRMETKETLVVMDTTLGKIKFKLYNDTPQHRDNFIKLAKAGQYDGLLFHRVIKDFMVQGGDVTSKDAPMNKQLGAGDLGYTIPAEFNYPQYFHKKGALCAARTGDEVNPEKASSASQFYIVTGKKYSEAELGQMEKQMEGRLKQAIFNRLQTENKSKIMELYRSGNKEELAVLRDTLIGKTELEAEKRKDETKMPSELRETYKTIGGVPFLDNQYTVYGEVVEGLDVVDAIQQVKTNKQDRPTENVVIKSVEVLE